MKAQLATAACACKKVTACDETESIFGVRAQRTPHEPRSARRSSIINRMDVWPHVDGDWVATRGWRRPQQPSIAAEAAYGSLISTFPSRKAEQRHATRYAPLHHQLQFVALPLSQI